MDSWSIVIPSVNDDIYSEANYNGLSAHANGPTCIYIHTQHYLASENLLCYDVCVFIVACIIHQGGIRCTLPQLNCEVGILKGDVALTKDKQSHE